jgi:fibronectin-binding autotransporter adhesin
LQPTLLALEDRRLLSTWTVTSTLDDGSTGTLRWAIGQANSAGGAETINFDPTVFATSQTITLSGTQLELSDKTGTETVAGPAAAWLSAARPR